MCASDLTSPSRPGHARGFSLIELLVALVFTAILTTGMLRIFASSVNGFYTQQETLGMQRNSRFVLGQIQEDFLQAGYLFPPRNLRGEFALGSAVNQPPLLIQQTAYTPIWQDANGTSAALNPVDEIQFVQDINLDVDGTLSAAANPNDAVATVNIPSGIATLNNFLTGTSNSLSMIMLDSQEKSVDMLKVKSIAGAGPYTVTLDYSAGATVDKFGHPVNGGFFTGTFANNHAVNAPCSFIAPLQVIRYTVVPRALDPANPATKVPCLVRQTAPLDKLTVFSPGATTIPPAPDTEQILAEGVTGFKVDISLDGGQTWLRYKPDGTLQANADSWTNFYGVLDNAVKNRALSAGSPLLANLQYGLNSPIDPLWLNYQPVTLRLDIQTSSRVARADYRTTSTGAPAFRTRTVTMLVSPRNYALGSSK